MHRVLPSPPRGKWPELIQIQTVNGGGGVNFAKLGGENGWDLDDDNDGYHLYRVTSRFPRHVITV